MLPHLGLQVTPGNHLTQQLLSAWQAAGMSWRWQRMTYIALAAYAYCVTRVV